MIEKIRDVRPPRGLARLGFRLPIWLYRLGLGGLLGNRFLLLTHTGRKSGRKRQTVLEVVRFDPRAETFIVAVGFGPQSDWYRNIRVHPEVTVQSGRKRWRMTAEILSKEQAGEEMLDYGRRHSRALRELVGFLGYRIDGSPASIRALGENLSMVAFRPTQDRK